MLEIPAGTLDPGESPRVTAERELGEECGLAADALGGGAVLLHGPRLLHRAADAVPGHRPAPDRCQRAPDDELLERSWLSLPDALAAIDDGRVIDAKSVAGILWLARRLAATDTPA